MEKIKKDLNARQQEVMRDTGDPAAFRNDRQYISLKKDYDSLRDLCHGTNARTTPANSTTASTEVGLRQNALPPALGQHNQAAGIPRGGLLGALSRR